MKVCKDCKHMRGAWKGFEECHAPGNLILDPVTGKSVLRWTFCETHRTGVGVGIILRYPMRICGKSPRWFEAKEE